MLIIGVVSFWKVSLLIFFQLIRELLKVVLYHLHCFLIHIDGLLGEIEKCSQLGVKLSENKMSGLMFADDFVGLAESGPALQSLIDIVHDYSKCWHFEASVRKYAVVVFSKLGNHSGKWI